MSKHLKWVALGCLSFALALPAQGAEKGIAMGGNVQGGYGYSWQPTDTAGTGSEKDSQFFGDAEWNTTATISDGLHVVIDNAFAVQPPASVQPNATFYGSKFNDSAYFSHAQLTLGANPNFIFANNGLYLEENATDNVKWAVGWMKTPFTMANLWDRYDMNSFYYASGYTRMFQYGWAYDMGAKITLTDVIPGTLEFALLDGRQENATTLTDIGIAGAPNIMGVSNTPAVSARWMIALKQGDWTLTPEVSTYLGRWRGGPADTGLSAGFMWKMGAAWLNAEWIYTSLNPTFASTDGAYKYWSIDVEPGMDLGMVTASLIGEINRTTNAAAAGLSNENLGFALSHTYNDKMQVKLAYEHENFNTTNGLAGNDLRLMFGTKF